MHTLTISRSDGKTRGRAAARPCMGYRPTSIDHYQSPPTVRNSSLARHSGRGSNRLGRFFRSLSDYCQFITATRAGLSAQQALALIDPTDGPGRQAMSAQSEVHLSASFKSAGFDTLEASGKDFAVEQKDSASGAKSD